MKHTLNPLGGYRAKPAHPTNHDRPNPLSAPSSSSLPIIARSTPSQFPAAKRTTTADQAYFSGPAPSKLSRISSSPPEPPLGITTTPIIKAPPAVAASTVVSTQDHIVDIVVAQVQVSTPLSFASSGVQAAEEQDLLPFCSTQYVTAMPTALTPDRSPRKARPCAENFWCLPSIVQDIYKQRGITTLYPWQIECLDDPNVLGGRNLVYSVPTSGGKTLPAEIHLLRTVLLKNKKALFVLPYVSIVQEKARWLSVFGKEMRFPIEPYYGATGPIPAPKGRSLSICTIEKANLLINQMIEDKRLNEIGLVVVDELHMVSEEDRGAVLELLLSKIIYCGKGNIQVIGMSATTGASLNELCRWLNAQAYTREFRPVELKEHYVVGNQVFNVARQRVRQLTSIGANADRELAVVQLVLEAVQATPMYSVLIFCATKKDTEELARSLAAQLALLVPGRMEGEMADEKRKLLEHFKAEASEGLAPLLHEVIPHGIAFHHSGLTSVERELIEAAFTQRILCVLTCTSTLAAGVNLPARRVILRGAKIGTSNLTSRRYLQMVGRAGRAGLESFGESYLCLAQRDAYCIDALVGKPAENVESGLGKNKRSDALGKAEEEKKFKDVFQRLVSDGVSGGYITSRTSLQLFIESTLSWQQGVKQVCQRAEAALDELIKDGFVVATTDTSGAQVLSAAPIAKATQRSNFVPQDAKRLYDELEKAMNDGVVLSDPLHRLYLISPLHASEPHWKELIAKISTLTKIQQMVVAERLELSREWLERRSFLAESGSRVPETDIREIRARRLWTALILLRLMSCDHNVQLVAQEFKMERGVLEALIETTAAYGHQVAALCKRLESPVWIELEALLLRFARELNHGVHEQALELVEIHGVKKARARQLWNAGYRTVQAVAKAKPDAMLARTRFGPFAEGIVRRIIEAANALLVARAQAMREQAAQLLQDSEAIEETVEVPANVI